MAGTEHPEIVIIRRGSQGDHDDHHGGVWKIAFADFMTAMMAFFLVMWLISANEKTRASVARYFNPVRLVDATTQPRGLRETKKDDSGITASSDTPVKTEEISKSGAPKAPPGGESQATREKRLDSELQTNPYVALSEIVASKGPGDVSAKEAPQPKTPNIGLQGGLQFRDPFAPPALSPRTDAARDPDPVSVPAPPVTPPTHDNLEKRETKKDAMQRQVVELQASLAATIKSSGVESGPRVEVHRTKEGLLLSLTDTEAFSMFANASAVPSRRVVIMMEKVAQLLKTRKGPIVLRGYTDSKPFRSGRYDNWRLSLDRAQVAHYMLVRGGLADARIAHVEGYADHTARQGIPADSPLNRRIEILLKDEET